MYGLTVVVVDGEEESRSRLLLCLRRLGLRALGVDTTADATALLEALDADVAVVHTDDDDAALAALRRRTIVVQVARRRRRRRSGGRAVARARPPRRSGVAQLAAPAGAPPSSMRARAVAAPTSSSCSRRCRRTRAPPSPRAAVPARRHPRAPPSPRTVVAARRRTRAAAALTTVDTLFARMLLSKYEIECHFHFHWIHDRLRALPVDGKCAAEHHPRPRRAAAGNPPSAPAPAAARDPDRSPARAAGHKRLHRHRRLRRAHLQRPLERARRRRPAPPRPLRRPQLHRQAALLRRARGRARRHLGDRQGRVRGRAGVPRLSRVEAAQLPRRRHHHPDGDHQRLSRAADLQRRRPSRDRHAHHPVDVARARRRHLRRVAPASAIRPTSSTASTPTASPPPPACARDTRKRSSRSAATGASRRASSTPSPGSSATASAPTPASASITRTPIRDSRSFAAQTATTYRSPWSTVICACARAASSCAPRSRASGSAAFID